MKKLLIMSVMLLLTTLSYGQKLQKGCWNGPDYTMMIAEGPTNGRIKVKVYEASNEAVLMSTQTLTLDNMGAVNFNVPQPIRENSSFVVVFFYNADGSVHSFSHGQGTDNNKLSTTTGSNACSVLALVPINLTAKRIDREHIQVTFTVDPTYDNNVQVYKIKVSIDGINFTEKLILFPNKIQLNRTYTVKIKI